MYAKKTNKDSSKQAVKPNTNNIQRSLSGLSASYLSTVSSTSQLRNTDRTVASEQIDFASKPIFQKGELNIQNSTPSFLTRDTPAWSDRGNIGIGPAFFQTDYQQQAEIMRHEQVHALHQRVAPTSNSGMARNYAESLASHTGAIRPGALLPSVPSLLAFPPQTHKPWDKVYIGQAGIIGELSDGGITLRIYFTYAELGLKDRYKPDKNLGIDVIDKRAYQMYHCAKHPYKNLKKVAARLKSVIKKVKALNKKMPAKSIFRVKFIFVSEHQSARYRTANKQGIVFLTTKELNTRILDTAAHEMSHGIIEHHSTAGNASLVKRQPDNVGLQVADIFLKLRNTKQAAFPTKKFNPRRPPPYTTKKSGGTMASGIIPFHDTVWSGAGGHPSSVDEFFASAFAAYTQEPKLLKNIVHYYNKHDNTIKPLYNQLIKVFKSIGNPKAVARTKAPASTKPAQQTLATVSAPVDYTGGKNVFASDEKFFDPKKLIGPNKIGC